MVGTHHPVDWRRGIRQSLLDKYTGYGNVKKFISWFDLIYKPFQTDIRRDASERWQQTVCNLYGIYLKFWVLLHQFKSLKNKRDIKIKKGQKGKRREEERREEKRREKRGEKRRGGEEERRRGEEATSSQCLDSTCSSTRAFISPTLMYISDAYPCWEEIVKKIHCTAERLKWINTLNTTSTWSSCLK